MQTRNLHVRFDQVHAVRGVDLAIAAGSCFGLLGPNGAGKTTTIECMEGITVPSEGEVLYRGGSLDARFAEQAGIMFQQTALQDFVTVGETLRMFHRLYQQSMSVPELIEVCKLQEFLDREPKKLSGGQRQRLLLAIALVGDPRIVFLDEPTTGLDPQARRNLWQLVRDIKARGVTVVMSTHYMDEAYELCDRIAIMDHGLVIAEGTPDELLSSIFSDVVMQLPVSDWPADLALERFAAHVLGEQIQLMSADVNQSIAALLEADVPLQHLQIRQRNLEDLFIELTGQELRA
ncbi:MAG: ABC transporter ATP-binding protein, partial [Granulosicoccaceae bacterium]